MSSQNRFCVVSVDVLNNLLEASGWLVAHAESVLSGYRSQGDSLASVLVDREGLEYVDVLREMETLRRMVRAVLRVGYGSSVPLTPSMVRRLAEGADVVAEWGTDYFEGQAAWRQKGEIDFFGIRGRDAGRAARSCAGRLRRSLPLRRLVRVAAPAASRGRRAA